MEGVGEEGVGFGFEGEGAEGAEADGEPGEFLFEGVVEFAGDALAFFEGGGFGDAGAEAFGLLGDATAEEGDPNESGDDDGGENGDEADEASGGPPGRGFQNANGGGVREEEAGGGRDCAEALVGAALDLANA